MTSEIIDQASALEEMMRDHAFRLTDSTTQQYQQRTVRNAETSYLMLVGKRIRDARCAWIAKRMQRDGISREAGNGSLLQRN